MTKAGLHQMVDRLPDQAVDGAAILLREVTDGRIDPDQASDGRSPGLVRRRID
jgi:hypothetical protein